MRKAHPWHGQLWAGRGRSTSRQRDWRTLLEVGAVARLFGYAGNWRTQTYPRGRSTQHLWDFRHFERIPDPSSADRGLQIRLKDPIVIDVPLDSVEVGDLDLAYALALQPDGKAILVGRAEDHSLPDFAVVRYTADGFSDDTFGADGVVRFTTNSVADHAADVIVLPDERIVVGGYSNGTNDYRYTLMVLDVNGVLDPAFGISGLAFVDSESEDDYLEGLHWDGDGILAVGRSESQGDGDFGIVRLNLDGSLDTSFANEGRMLVDFFGSYDTGRVVRIQPDGKIVVVGAAYEGNVEGLGMVRINR